MGTQRAVAHGALDYAELAAHGLRADGVLDFSSNVNPFGPPPGVRAAMAALDPAPYPDRSCLRLRQELAARHRCELEQVLPGNGSNELIHLLARALLRPGDVSLVVAPTFGEYAHASQLAEAQVVEWRTCAGEHFAADPAEVMEQVQKLRPHLTWLCAPNNPTGTDITLPDLHVIAAACAANGGLLVVDRTYHAFRRGHDPLNDGLDHAAPGVLRLHSLTKSHALAGLRLGYLLGAADVIGRVAAYQPAWSVSSAAQVAGLAALDDADFLPRTLPLLWAASDDLRDGLERMGLTVWRGLLPFLLARTGDGATTRAALLAHACVVRDCVSFGLPEWIRIAPRGPDDNKRLLRVWKEIL